MTTVIRAYDHDGNLEACTELCYNAETDTCDCICGGRNHGRGLSQAIENNKVFENEMTDELRQTFKTVFFLQYLPRRCISRKSPENLLG